jgi:nitroreductase
VGEHPVVARARRLFVKAPAGTDARSSKVGLSPYARDLERPIPVEYEALLELAERRRSVRWFEQRPVPRELVDKAVEVAGLSPSACNRQPFEFRAFDDPELVQRVASIPMGTRGWSGNIPMFVVIVGSLSAFFDERDRHLIYTDSSLAAMSFVFALETLGLSTCCVNWPDIAEREDRMRLLLGLSPGERPVMCIAIGYPDREGLVPFSHKKAVRELVRYNEG